MLQIDHNIKAVTIGGSAGSLPVLIQILDLLSPAFIIPIIIVIHRPRNALSELAAILSSAVGDRKIMEPDDKTVISSNSIYIAPQNYHLLVEKNSCLSLDYSEPVQYSRPSIDVTFESAARVYKNELISILLSGANNDGTAGQALVTKLGGIAIAQDPATAAYKAMPSSAVKNVRGIMVLEPLKIGELLNDLVAKGK